MYSNSNNKYRINKQKEKKRNKLYYPYKENENMLKIILAIMLFILSLGTIAFMFITFNIDEEKIKELEKIEDLEKGTYYFKIGSYTSNLQKDIFWVIIGSLCVISILLIVYLAINLKKR